MCTEYWTLQFDHDCPLCGSHEASQLQTHWLGEFAGFSHAYELGDRLPHLRGIEAATLGHDEEDSFISICDQCRGACLLGSSHRERGCRARLALPLDACLTARTRARLLPIREVM